MGKLQREERTARDTGKGARHLGAGVWKRDQEPIWETNASSRAGSQQCGVAPPASKAAGWGSSHPARLPEAELKVPTGQSSSGLIPPCPGSTCVEARLFVKLQAAEKQTLLVALSRHRAEGAGVLQMLGVLQMSVTWQAPGGGLPACREPEFTSFPCCCSLQCGGPHSLRREKAAVSSCQVGHGNSQKNQFQLLFLLVLVVQGFFCSSLRVELWLRLTSGSLECEKEDQDSTTALDLLFDTLPLCHSRCKDMQGWCTLLPLGASFLIHCPSSPYTLCHPSQEPSWSFVPSGRGQEGGAPPYGGCRQDFLVL